MYAVILNGVVQNTIIWDGITTWQPPEGCSVVSIPPGASVSPGFLYENGQFVDPNAPKD